MIDGLDRAVMTMKKGELALVTIHSEYGFGNIEVQRDFATIPPCSTIIYEVEMLDFTGVFFKTLDAYKLLVTIGFLLPLIGIYVVLIFSASFCYTIYYFPVIIFLHACSLASNFLKEK